MIAMCSDAETEEQREILLLDLANDDVRSLGPGTYPSWSGDGTKLFFRSTTTEEMLSVDVTDPESQPERFVERVPSLYSVVSGVREKWRSLTLECYRYAMSNQTRLSLVRQRKDGPVVCLVGHPIAGT